MVKSAHFILFCLCSSFAVSNAQENSDLKTKQSEHNSLKKEISELETEIQKKSMKEKELFNLLQNYSKQGHLLNKIIAQYRVEEKRKQDQIMGTEQKIQSLTNEIALLQNNYAKYARAIYTKKQNSELSVIFDSESVSQALRRLHYFKKFSERRERDYLSLQKNKSALQLAKIQLENEKKEKSEIVLKKIDEEKVLKKKSAERKQILSDIKKDKVELKKELNSKKRAEGIIRNLIASLIEDNLRRENEIKKKQELMENEKISLGKIEKENRAVDLKTKQTQNSRSEINLKVYPSFENLKGKMKWPVNSGTVIRKYGENKNLVLNTVTLNYGIDIKVFSDLKVKTVSEGEISAIEWIPGYGSIIIVTHSNDYRTVYSHLEEIYVQEGEIVKAGQVIATIGETIEGNVLHFEIWNSRSNQNPEIWLAKK